MRALFHLACIVPLMLLRGVIVQDIWGWFITPLGLPELGLVHAIGVSLTISWLTYQHVVDPFDKIEDKWTQTISRIATGMLFNLVTWGVAAIVASFM